MTDCRRAVNHWPFRVLTLDFYTYAGWLLETLPSFPKNKLASFLLAKPIPSTGVLVVYLHWLAPALDSGLAFLPVCHLEKPPEPSGRESKVHGCMQQRSHYGQRAARAEQHHQACSNRAEKTCRELPVCPSSLHGLCEALGPSFQPRLALWGPVRLSSLFPPPAPSQDPSRPVLGHLPSKGRPVSRDARNHHAAQSASGAREANRHAAGITATATVSGSHFLNVYYSFHSWPCLYYYSSFHVKEEILLLNHCLWSPLCTQLPRSARCWFAADELLAWAAGLAIPLTSVWCAQPRQNWITAPKEGCLWMHHVPTGLLS